jgi:predicted AAA+ superfamily ATPase
LLTGSANVLTLQHVSETLAGRIALHQLHPFSYAELHRQGTPVTILQRLFAVSDPSALLQELPKAKTRSSQALLSTMLHGGYPVPALAENASLRTTWFEGYRKTYIERDVLELQTIERLPEFSRLMLLATARTGQVLNFADLGRDAGLPYVTLRRYMQLLEQTYQVTLVPPYFANVSKQLAKAPKLYWNDTGMATHLLGIHDIEALSRHPKLGALVETWVAQELLKLLALSPQPMRLYGWRLQSGPEVDFLIEQGDRLLAIEVKWGRQLEPPILRTVRQLHEQLGPRLLLSVILYGGEEVVALQPQLVAVPYDVFFRGE